MRSKVALVANVAGLIFAMVAFPTEWIEGVTLAVIAGVFLLGSGCGIKAVLRQNGDTRRGIRTDFNIAYALSWLFCFAATSLSAIVVVIK